MLAQGQAGAAGVERNATGAQAQLREGRFELRREPGEGFEFAVLLDLLILAERGQIGRAVVISFGFSIDSVPMERAKPRVSTSLASSTGCEQ